MLWIAYTSFRVESSIFGESVLSPANEYTLQNYETVLSVTNFPRYFLNSLEIGLTVTALSLFVSIIGAYGLSRFDVKGKNALIIGIFSTQMFPQVLLMIPIYLVIVALSMLNRVIGVVLGQMILILPFQIWMLKGYFDGLPPEIDDAAQIDGTNIAQRLLLVILPVASPGVAVAAFYSFVVSWGDYLIVSVRAKGADGRGVALVGDPSPFRPAVAQPGVGRRLAAPRVAAAVDAARRLLPLRRAGQAHRRPAPLACPFAERQRIVPRHHHHRVVWLAAHVAALAERAPPIAVQAGDGLGIAQRAGVIAERAPRPGCAAPPGGIGEGRVLRDSHRV